MPKIVQTTEESMAQYEVRCNLWQQLRSEDMPKIVQTTEESMAQYEVRCNTVKGKRVLAQARAVLRKLNSEFITDSDANLLMDAAIDWINEAVAYLDRVAEYLTHPVGLDGELEPPSWDEDYLLFDGPLDDEDSLLPF